MPKETVASPQSTRAPSRKQRVFVVDDHPIVRQGLALLINQEPDLIVCGEADEAQIARQKIDLLKPDVVVLDLSLPGPDGLELLKEFRVSHPKIPILVLSMHEESVYAERALRAGAKGYVMKQEATERVLVALRRILRQEVYVSDRIASEALHQIVARPARPTQTPVATLSDRELEVFSLIGEGLGTRQIADKLGLSIKTVESYQAHIKGKLGLTSGRAMMQRAIEWRLSERVS